VTDAPALGAQVDALGTRFAVRAAAPVTLCLFQSAGERRVPMTETNGVWHAYVPGVGAGAHYGYRTACDPAKLLVDPYAVELDRSFRYDSRLGEPAVDTTLLVPRAIVPPSPRSDAPGDGATVARGAAVEAPIFAPGGLIYEVNVRGFTMLHPDVPASQRGTIGALAHPSIIAHLRALRVDAVELMPIVAWIDERHLPRLTLANAWGYNPVVPMAIDPRLAPGGVAELRDTIATLRAAGIGVILDLVFNHTGESDVYGPTLSLRGLDDALYYARADDGTLINDSGTGNTLDCSQAVVRAMILDSLRHFARLGVDGFRFDLATVLARGPGFDPRAPIFAEIAADQLLASRIMIAEPWDIGPGGYQLGKFPHNWLEWNDRYRDDVRRFWKGAAAAGELATRIAGSDDLFGPDTTRTINFVAAHDGFTLADTVSYAERHNAANGEGNRDGHGDNHSWNNGIEGWSDEPLVLSRRTADVRALLATLFASRGTIMLTAGDEFGRTQQGNNNAYAQDNPIGWVDWEGRDRDLQAFVSALATFRATCGLHRVDPYDDPDWRRLDGEPMQSDDWHDAQGFELRLPCGAARVTLRLDRAARRVTLTHGFTLESRA